MAAGAYSWSHALLLALVCCFGGVLCVSANEGGGHHVSSRAPAPSTSSADCSSALLSLADCLTFVEEGSTEVKPQGQCCPGLKKVVKKEASCLCQAFGADFGIKINMTKALSLPHACGAKTTPFTKCHTAVGSPGAAPVLPPAAAPTASPGQSVVRVPAPAASPMQSAAVSLLTPSMFLLTIAAVYFSSHLREISS